VSCEVTRVKSDVNMKQLCCSSTKANGYSEFGVKDKQGFIENELVSANDN
jgi:SET domain-containing protein